MTILAASKHAVKCQQIELLSQLGLIVSWLNYLYGNFYIGYPIL